MTAIDTFKAKAPGVMQLLMADFGLNDLSAAAIVGNLGHESNGFATLQEIKPVVKGSRGGYGWAQWTGPRRREYEAYCKRNSLDPASDKANYGFLFVELTGTEKKAIAAVKSATGLDDKVEAFEKAFLRAGVKHYPSRKEWALRALTAYQAAMTKPAAPKPVTPPAKPSNPAIAPVGIATLIALAAAAIAGFWHEIANFFQGLFS